jgi:O-antigen/teichoic acid export membrane protein
MSAQAPSRIARAGTRSLGMRIVEAVVNALVLLVTARGFGADGRGFYALAMLACTFMGLPVLGITNPLAAEYAHRRSTLAQLYSASIAISLGLGGLIAAGALIVAVAVWPDWAWLGFAAAPLPILCLAQCQLQLFQVQGAVMRMGLTSLAMSVATLLSLSVVAVVASGRIYVALVAWAIAQPLVPLGVLFLQHRESGFDWSGLRERTWRLLRRGFPITLANVVLRLNYRVDVFVVAAMLPLAEVGKYSIAVAAGEVLWETSRALITGAYPTIAGGALDESVRVTTRSFRHSAFVLAAGGIASAAVAFVCMGAVFGSDFDRVWIPMALLVPGVVGLGSAEVLRVFFLVRLERSREYLVASAASMVVNLALALALVPLIGISGAAISTSASYVLGCTFLSLRFAASGGSRRVRDYLPGRAEAADYLRLAGYYGRVLRRVRPAG